MCCAWQVGYPEAFGVETDRFDCESSLPVLVLRYIANRACFGVDTDGIGYDTAFKVPVLRYVVNGACLGIDTD